MFTFCPPPHFVIDIKLLKGYTEETNKWCVEFAKPPNSHNGHIVSEWSTWVSFFLNTSCKTSSEIIMHGLEQETQT